MKIGLGDEEIVQGCGSRVAGCRDLLQHERSPVSGGMAPNIGDLRLGKASSLHEYHGQMANYRAQVSGLS